MSKKILLTCVGGINRTGVPLFIYDWIKAIRESEIDADITVYFPGSMNDREFYNEIQAQNVSILTGDIEAVSKYKDKKYQADLSQLIASEGYDIVHVNTGSVLGQYIALRIANQHKVAQIVAHSHNAATPGGNSGVKKLLYNWFRRKIVKYSTDCCGCSAEAGKWLFGDDVLNNEKWKFIPNVINSEKFRFRYDCRCERRNLLHLEPDTFVIGTVGALTKQKNHQFLIEIAKMLEKIKIDYKIVIFGEGTLRKKLENAISEEGLNDRFLLPGNMPDIFNWLSTMDLFVFPSNYEGFGRVVLEAQANGLPCIVSKAIPDEAILSNSVVSLPLDAEEWANVISKIHASGEISNRETAWLKISESIYDQRNLPVLVEKLYN